MLNESLGFYLNVPYISNEYFAKKITVKPIGDNASGMEESGEKDLLCAVHHHRHHHNH